MSTTECIVTLEVMVSITWSKLHQYNNVTLLKVIISGNFIITVPQSPYYRQGRPEKLRGPGQRVKVGPLTQVVR